MQALDITTISKSAKDTQKPAKGNPSTKDKTKQTILMFGGGRVGHRFTDGSVDKKEKGKKEVPVVDPRTLSTNMVYRVFLKTTDRRERVEGSFTLEALSKLMKMFIDKLRSGTGIGTVYQSPSSKNKYKRKEIPNVLFGEGVIFNLEGCEEVMGKNSISTVWKKDGWVYYRVDTDFLRSLDASSPNLSKQFRVGYKFRVKLENGDERDEFLGSPFPSLSWETKDGETKYLKSLSGYRITEILTGIKGIQVSNLVEEAKREAVRKERAALVAKPSGGWKSKTVMDLEKSIYELQEQKKIIEPTLTIESMKDLSEAKLREIDENLARLKEELEAEKSKDKSEDESEGNNFAEVTKGAKLPQATGGGCVSNETSFQKAFSTADHDSDEEKLDDSNGKGEESEGENPNDEGEEFEGEIPRENEDD